jgi:hypothetical protein
MFNLDQQLQASNRIKQDLEAPQSYIFSFFFWTGVKEQCWDEEERLYLREEL